MDIKYSQGTSLDFDDFYKFFRNSLETQFTHYSKNVLKFYDEVDIPEDFMREQVKNGRKLIFLAKDGEKVVGYLQTTKNYGGVSLANWMAVEEEYQGHGIATSLIKLWEETALGNGGHALQAWTPEKNRGFYLKEGFKEAGTVPTFWFGITYLLFYKILREAKEENYLGDFIKSK